MIRAIITALVLLGMGRAGISAQQETPTRVEPDELRKREDLIGKLVVVDDRVRFFQNHPRIGYDELYLRRTPIPVRLPESLRPQSAPRNPAVVVTARLSREDSNLYLDALALDLQPSDLERLDRATARLSARDFESRRSWARWAESRAKAFHDEPLAARARVLENEALEIEAEARRLTVDAPREWLSLARQGRKQGVAEPGPSALAHRAFRARLASPMKPEELESLRSEVEEFFPSASHASKANGSVPQAVGDAYDRDAASTYRAASADMRQALDRRLWADVVQKLLETRVAEDVQSALRVVDEAERLLPDRPALVGTLVEQARRRAQQGLDGLRLDDLRTVAALLRDRAGDPDAALELKREWLRRRRERLSDADAEGPVTLAAEFEELLNDGESARRLLERAWKIAPGSSAIVDAFKIRGYRREGDAWVKDAPAVVDQLPDDEAKGLRGKTPAEVRAALGVGPNRTAVVATKGRVVLQWMFDGPRQRRYINFVRLPGQAGPRVASDYFLPH